MVSNIQGVEPQALILQVSLFPMQHIFEGTTFCGVTQKSMQSLVECSTGLDWHVAIAKENKIAHEPGDSELGNGGLLG